MTHTTSKTILIVDDTLENLQLLSEILIPQGYRVKRAISGTMALKSLSAISPDLILLDVHMLDMTGYDVCKTIKQDPSLSDIPVIFVSASGGRLDKVLAFSVGGADYIPKPFAAAELLARVEHQLSLKASRQEIQQLNTALEQRVQERTAELKAANDALKKEITEREKVQDKLTYLAWHDSLTGLPNRSFVIDQLMQSIKITKDQPDYKFAVLFLDCDGFKVINDSFGHVVGDQLLVLVSQRLALAISEYQATLARLGGDEFTILLKDIENLQFAEEIAQALLQSLEHPFHLSQHEIYISASIGLVLGSSQSEEPANILRDADTAMYQAKTLGKAQYQVFDEAMHEQVRYRLQLETDLRQAIEHQEFHLHYQPIACLKTGDIISVEALLRWHHPVQGLIAPDSFIPLAEETGLILPLGLWVLEEACRQLKEWQNAWVAQTQASSSREEEPIPLKMSVNLSAKQFSQPNLLSALDQILWKTGLDSQYLKLEITESALIDNPDGAAQILQQFKTRHIQLAIDDFGTGYSSLSYLHRFPVDTLKLDRSFIQAMNTEDQEKKEEYPKTPSSTAYSIIQATVNLAHSLDMNVIAEGIETNIQLQQLRSLNCEMGQGYYLSKPLDKKSMEQLLKAQTTPTALAS